ncbi:hypothetical protein NMG60_11024010 [Bertholletia excelsa]
MDSDEEDYVFFGTPIEREEEITSRKKKAVAEASGQLRTLAPWKQEVRDEEGRRRFHGAFTGGFSAGYYNTVGSKEGWAPQSFTSSRKNRAEIKKQSILNFLDDDEKEEFEGRSLGTSMQFDTFGFTAAELARKQAEKEQQQRPSVIPGPAPDELVLPITDSVGVKLLLKMGWRHGQAIRDLRTNSLYDARREARKAFLALSSDDTAPQLSGSEAFEGDLETVMELPMNNDHQFQQSTPVYVLDPKQDLHGLGYDPFKHAPEFREKKRSLLQANKDSRQGKHFSIKDSLFAFRTGRVAPGFGIGALEELDAEDEDVYASGYNFEETCVQEIEEPSKLSIEDTRKRSGKERGVLPGFKVASNSDYQLERYDPPVIPKDYAPHHKFPAPLDADNYYFDAPPAEIPPPEDSNLKLLIDGVATIVARCGKLFEDLSREKNQSNPLFSFLNGGNGQDYYLRRLWEERQKRNDHKKQQLDGKTFLSMQKMTAESRGRILGEKPLERSTKDVASASTSGDIHLQYNLSDTFIKPASFKTELNTCLLAFYQYFAIQSELPDVAKPFCDDPAKQERFEQFLKQKYHGGLRSKDSGGASNMSEAARARERLEFEAAAEAMMKGKSRKQSSVSNQQFMDMPLGKGLQFTAGGLEQVSQAEDLKKKMYPKREEFQWRPSPILCKRFDIIDPYMGKPAPPPRVRSKMDSLIFMPDSIKHAKVEENTTYGNPLPLSQSGIEEIKEDKTDRDTELDVQVENVERPVDLYKAIFSDDSGDEEEGSSLNQVEDPRKKIEAANTALNRLIAGDFLESLGKELGLEVPPDLPYPDNKTRTMAVQNEAVDANKGNVENKPASTSIVANRISIIQEVAESKEYHRDNAIDEASNLLEFTDGEPCKSGKGKEAISSENGSGKVELGKEAQEDRATRNSSHRHRKQNSSSSEDERSAKAASHKNRSRCSSDYEHSRKRHRGHQHRQTNSDSETTDSTSDYLDRHHSKSKGRNKESSGEKSSSRKRSKRHKHRSDESLSRSHRGTEKERDSKREKRI